MPDDSVTNTISLIFNTTNAQDQISGNNSPLELERQFCSGKVLLSRADVVEKACEVVGFVIVGPRWEMCFHEGASWTIGISKKVSVRGYPK